MSRKELTEEDILEALEDDDRKKYYIIMKEEKNIDLQNMLQLPSYLSRTFKQEDTLRAIQHFLLTFFKFRSIY